LAKIPSDISGWIESAQVQDGQRLHNVLLLIGGELASAPSQSRVDQAARLLKTICAIPLSQGLDEVYVAYLAAGLVSFEDMAGGLLEPVENIAVRNKILECGAWLAHAKDTRPFGMRETEGTYVWNHSVIAGVALAMCGLHVMEPRRRRAYIDFGVTRLEKFLAYGINEHGIPYEGFSYCGVVFRIVGLFSLLVAGDPHGLHIYGHLRNKYKDRLGNLLDWMDACSFPSGTHLISYNHSEYSPTLAVGGLLLFFGQSDPLKASCLWDRFVGRHGTNEYGDTTDLARCSAFEGMFFLVAPPSETCPFLPASVVDLRDGWILVQSGSADKANKLFLKSSRLITGPHNQSDVNHFTVILGGKPVFVDAGAANKVGPVNRDRNGVAAATYRLEGSGASSFGHNAILIDGKGQAPSGEGAGVQGKVLRCEKTQGAWVISASAKQAYDRSDYNPVNHAIRHVVFFEQPQPHLFIFDDIEAVGARVSDFVRILHMPRASIVEAEDDHYRLRLSFGGETYDVSFVTGSVSSATTELSRQNDSREFAGSLMETQVRAVNPFFWFLCTKSAAGEPRPKVVSEEKDLSWHFDVCVGGAFVYGLDIEKTSAAKREAKVFIRI
jgi:hypothetical protein